MPQTWDEQGNLIPAPQGGQSWDEQGNPIQAAPKAAPMKPSSMRAYPKPFTVDWLKRKGLDAETSFESALPAAGATIGGVAGGMSAGPPGAVGGAGFGGMGGEAARQILRRAMGWGGPATSGEAAQDITKAGVTQAAIQVPTEVAPMLKGPLSRMAEGQYSRALAPTTNYMKATARDVVPGLIDRGEVGSLESLNKRAGERVGELMPELEKEYKALQASSPKLPVRGAGGRMQASTVGQIPQAGTQVLKDLDALKSKYMVKDAAGNLQVANQQAVSAIDGVQATVKKFGKNISPESLRQLKQIFDEPVAKAGGYAGADLATHYTLNAQEAAANSIRKILRSASPNISELNKEVSFWLDVQLVTGKTLERQTGQSGGLVKVLAPLAGGAAADIGFHFGGTAGGIEAGAATAGVVIATKMIRSPLWRTTSAVFKDRVARALASGSIGELSSLATRVGIAAQEAGPEMERRQQTPAN
jgi:hypothetical protein